MSIHVALVVGVEVTAGGGQRAAAERHAQALESSGAWVRRLISVPTGSPAASAAAATQVAVARALDDLAAAAVGGARITLVYCGPTVSDPARGTLMAASDTPLVAPKDMWSIDQVLRRFEGSAGPVSVVVEGAARALPAVVPREVEWWPGESGFRVFEIRDSSDGALGFVVVTGASYDTAKWNPDQDYWLWTTSVKWPDQFKLVWSDNQSDDSRFDSLTPYETYDLNTFAEDDDEPPASPSGKLYRVTKKVGLVYTTLHLYLHHTGTGSGATTEWWAEDAVLSTINFIVFPDTHTHIFNKITSPPANPPTNRHITVQTSS